MLRTILILIFILVQPFLVEEIYAQFPGDVKEYIRTRFERYCESAPWEEIYLHTDRKEYLAGEEIWFTIYLIDRQTSGLSSSSSIAYFELLNAENKPVVQKRFRLISGIGPGHILIPDSLGSGMYTLRAYTNWMKNFLPVNCYMKEINIYNPFNIKSFKRKIYRYASENEVATDSIETKTSSDKMIINAHRLVSGDIELSIQTKDSIIPDNSKEYFLFIQTHGNIDRFTTESLTGEMTRIIIPGSSLSGGINHLTLFNSEGKPVWEEYMITHSPHRKISPAIKSADSISTRSKIDLEFELPDGFNPGNISIAVVPAGMTGDDQDIGDYLIFGSEFGLYPYKGKGGSPDYLNDAEVFDSISGSLRSYWLTWDKILSDNPAVFKYKPEKESHQLVGLLLTEDQQVGYPDEKIILSIPGKIAQFQYAVTDYKGNFEFSLPVDYDVRELIIQSIDTVRNYRIFVESSFSDMNYPSDVIIDSVPDLLKRSVSDWSLNYQIGKIYGSSYTGEIESTSSEELPLKRFYGKPDVEIVLKDFISLSTMEEVFFELIPRVRLVKTGSSYEIHFLNINGEKAYEDPPVLMIDGVVYNNISLISRLDPGVVEKIDVIRGIYHVGDFAFYGIVNIITNAGNFLSISLPEYASRVFYRAIEPALKFVSPLYEDVEESESREPDFRNTLYWNPSVSRLSDGTFRAWFTTGDLTTDYCITVSGVTTEGITISSKKIISVK